MAEVTDVERLGPRVVRVILGGPGLAGFDATEFTDQYVKLLIPPLGATYGPPFNVEEIRAQLPSNQWPRTRTYTAHSWDAERQRLSIDFVIHGQTGVAGPWAAAAQPGDMIQFDGPGGSYAPDPRAGWHLMVGDFSVLPAISASLSRVPSDVPAYVFVELDAFEKKRELHTPGDLHCTWVNRAGVGGLAAAVSQLKFPPGHVHCFVHGEASSVRMLRRHLLVERRLPRDGALSISGYWKRNYTEEGWQKDKMEWNRQVEQDAHFE